MNLRPILTYLFLVVSAQAQTSGSVPWTLDNGNTLRSPVQTYAIVIRNQVGGEIKINLNGKVEITGMTVDEASRVFWDALKDWAPRCP